MSNKNILSEWNTYLTLNSDSLAKKASRKRMLIEKRAHENRKAESILFIGFTKRSQGTWCRRFKPLLTMMHVHSSYSHYDVLALFLSFISHDKKFGP